MKCNKFNISSLLLICLSGCNFNNSSSNINTKELSIIAPTGAPSVAFLNYLNDKKSVRQKKRRDYNHAVK